MRTKKIGLYRQKILAPLTILEENVCSMISFEASSKASLNR